MTTLREWFDGFMERTGEKPEQVVFGYEHDFGRQWDVSLGTLLDFDTLDASVLDRGFDASFGGNETPDLCAWSPSWVLFSDDYDGAEHLCWVPRNPIAHRPIRPGGG